MRCPDCNKFVSLEMSEPEVSNLEVEYTPGHDADNTPIHEFHITGQVRIARTCAECGQDMKEYTFDIEQDVEMGENVTFEMTEKLRADPSPLNNVTVDDSPAVDIIEEGGGRYQRAYFGATVHIEVFLGTVIVAAVDWSDKVAASGMDELV
jgi:hypothetical protein